MENGRPLRQRLGGIRGARRRVAADRGAGAQRWPPRRAGLEGRPERGGKRSRLFRPACATPGAPGRAAKYRAGRTWPVQAANGSRGISGPKRGLRLRPGTAAPRPASGGTAPSAPARGPTRPRPAKFPPSPPENPARQRAGAEAARPERNLLECSRVCSALRLRGAVPVEVRQRSAGSGSHERQGRPGGRGRTLRGYSDNFDWP